MGRDKTGEVIKSYTDGDGRNDGEQTTTDHIDPEAPVEQAIDRYIVCDTCKPEDGKPVQMQIIASKDGAIAECPKCKKRKHGSDDKDAVGKAKANKDLLKALRDVLGQK